MKIIINDEKIKINNFVNYLIENHNQKGKNYQFELIPEDKFDKRFILEKQHSLKDHVLVLHNDGFEVMNINILEDYQEFITATGNFIDSKDFKDLYMPENFKNQFIHYQLIVKENDTEIQFTIHFLDVSKKNPL